MTEELSFQTFHALLNQEFQVEQEPGKWMNMVLVEASELKFKYGDADESELTSFALVFGAGSDVQLSQNTYSVKHEEIGELKVFLVPIQPDDDGARYEAVFT